MFVPARPTSIIWSLLLCLGLWWSGAAALAQDADIQWSPELASEIRSLCADLASSDTETADYAEQALSEVGMWAIADLQTVYTEGSPSARKRADRLIARLLPHRATKPHWEVRTDISEAHARQMAEELERTFQLFLKTFSAELDLKQPENRLAFWSFSKKEHYDLYVKDKFPDEFTSTGGLTNGSFVVAYDFGREDFNLDTVRHEGTHAIVNATLTPYLPAWLHEGFAGYIAIMAAHPEPSNWHKMDKVLQVLESEKESGAYAKVEDIAEIKVRRYLDVTGNDDYVQSTLLFRFLLVGEGGKYRDAFVEFLAKCAKSFVWQNRFLEAFRPHLPRLNEEWTKDKERLRAQLRVKVHAEAQTEIRLLTRLIETESDNPLHYSLRSGAYFRLRDYESAAKDMRKAAELAPERAESHVNLAWVLWYLEEWDEVVAELEKALEQDPAHPMARMYLAIARGKQRENE